MADPTATPYTDEDLRHEAARQLLLSVEDPDFMGIGERMDGTPIPSTVVDLEPETGEPLEMSRAWSHLPREDFDAAQRSIDELLTCAADTSDWAINLGADGLEPHGRALDAGDGPRFRVHFAFAKDMSDDDRNDLISQFAAFMIHGLT